MIFKDSRSRPFSDSRGFTMVELMVSITLLILGVVLASGVMILTEQNENISQERYMDYAELRSRVEEFKSQASNAFPSGVSLSEFNKTITRTGNTCTSVIQTGAAGLANLVRIDLSVSHGENIAPIQVVTYVRVAN